jgi:hypothetical protein
MLRIGIGVALAASLAAAPLPLDLSASFAAPAKKGYKTCRHKKSNGRIKTWRCRKDQPCCSAEWMNYYTCGSKLLGCL